MSGELGARLDGERIPPGNGDRALTHDVEKVLFGERDPTITTIPPGSRLLPLTVGCYCLVSECDWPIVSVYRWHLCDGYARGKLGGITTRGVLLHRFLMGLPFGVQVDHINRCTLDNRRCNLRTATNQENHFNMRPRGRTSQYKGVYRRGEKWRAQICTDGRKTYLGQFGTEDDAARAYDAAAREHFGEFAVLNFGEE